MQTKHFFCRFFILFKLHEPSRAFLFAIGGMEIYKSKLNFRSFGGQNSFVFLEMLLIKFAFR